MKKLFFIIIIIFILIPAHSILGADRDLEVNYPTVPNAISKPSTTSVPLPEYVQYIYYFAIGLGVIIALIVLTLAGVQYMTSAGDPGKLQESKDRVISALIGLLILAGSGVILATIFPGFVILDIKEISPTISSIPTGVIICKEPVDLETAWKLSREFYMTNPSDARKKEIREQIEPIIKEAREKCFNITSSSDIPDNFDNIATHIWFLPNWWYDYENQTWKSEEYGAIAYEETGFSGKATPYVVHLESVDAKAMKPYLCNISGASSIIPFRLIYTPDPGWYITIYNNYNYNDGIAEEDKKEAEYMLSSTVPLSSSTSITLPLWWRRIPPGKGQEGRPWGDWYPKSMKTEGSILTLLATEEERYEAFFSNDVPNLDAFDNIIEWEKCEGYEGEERQRGWFFKECAHCKVDAIYMIAAEKL